MSWKLPGNLLCITLFFTSCHWYNIVVYFTKKNAFQSTKNFRRIQWQNMLRMHLLQSRNPPLGLLHLQHSVRASGTQLSPYFINWDSYFNSFWEPCILWFIQKINTHFQVTRLILLHVWYDWKSSVLYQQGIYNKYSYWTPYLQLSFNYAKWNLLKDCSLSEVDSNIFVDELIDNTKQLVMWNIEWTVLERKQLTAHMYVASADEYTIVLFPSNNKKCQTYKAI